MTTPAEIQEQVRTLEQGLSDDDLVELWLAEAQRPGRDRQRMLSDLAQLLGGEPRAVLESLDQWELAQLQGEANRTVWQEPMLTPGAAAESLGAKPTNREKVRRLRMRSALIGLPHDHAFLYPAFQFDVRRRCVFSEVETVNRMLNAADNPWGVASWWIGQHDRLNARPMDLVGHGRVDDLVAVAEAVLEPVG